MLMALVPEGKRSLKYHLHAKSKRSNSREVDKYVDDIMYLEDLLHLTYKHHGLDLN